MTPRLPQVHGARVPLVCRAMLPVRLPSAEWLEQKPRFAFAMSLVPLGDASATTTKAQADVTSDAAGLAAAAVAPASGAAGGARYWRFMVSWGVDDASAAVSLLTLRR